MTQAIDIGLSDLEEGVFEEGALHGTALDLVQQIMTFSRKSDSEKRPLRIDLVLKEALELIRASIPSTILIEKSIISHTAVLGDPTQIHQVIMNLCTNPSINITLFKLSINRNCCSVYYRS